MSWQEQLKTYENHKDWDAAIGLLQQVISSDQNDLDAYLSMNYLLMNLLVEEDYDKQKHDYYVGLLRKYFLESNTFFSTDSEYLFYTGITAFISEWYYDITIEEAKAMIDKAFDMEPDNKLYEWGHYAYIDMSNPDTMAKSLVCGKEVLANPSLVQKLKSKGALGNYILEIIG